MCVKFLKQYQMQRNPINDSYWYSFYTSSWKMERTGIRSVYSH